MYHMSNQRSVMAQWQSAWIEIEGLRVPSSLEALPCVSLSKRLFPLLSTGSTQEELSRHDWKIVDWDVKNQNNQTKHGNQPRLVGDCMFRLSRASTYCLHTQSMKQKKRNRRCLTPLDSWVCMFAGFALTWKSPLIWPWSWKTPGIWKKCLLSSNCPGIL